MPVTFFWHVTVPFAQLQGCAVYYMVP